MPTINLSAAGKCILVVLLLLVVTLLFLRSGPHTTSSSKAKQPAAPEEEHASPSHSRQDGEQKKKSKLATITLQRQIQENCGLRQYGSIREGSEDQGGTKIGNMEGDKDSRNIDEKNEFSVDEQDIRNADNGGEDNQDFGEDMREPETNYELWGTETNHAPSCQYINEIGYMSAEYWIRSSEGVKPQKRFCKVDHFCDGLAGGWTRVAHLDMSMPDHHCPPNWREVKSPKRSCGRRQVRGGLNGAGCSAAIFRPRRGSGTIVCVCGRVVGYQYCNTMAFWSYNRKRYTSINEPFLDGVTISRLRQSFVIDREHVWSFVSALHAKYAGIDAVCPCNHQDHHYQKLGKAAVPPWVEEDYFCETGAIGDEAPPRTSRECVRQHATTFYTNNRLWDGEGCHVNSTCCDFNGPPWFCKRLEEKSNMPLEVRICSNGYITFSDTPIELMELYIQ